MSNECHSCCVFTCPHPSTFQSLGELDFERGIWKAAINGNTDRITEIITKKQSDVNAVDKFGYTALACKMLIEAGAELFAKTSNDGATPAHRAAFCGNLDILKHLCDIGGPKVVECLNSSGQNCLHAACRGNKIETVEWLEENYPHLMNCTDDHGKIPNNYLTN